MDVNDSIGKQSIIKRMTENLQQINVPEDQECLLKLI